MQRVFIASLACTALAFALVPGCGSDDGASGGSDASGGSSGSGGSGGGAGTGSGARGGSSGASGAAGAGGRGGASGAGGAAGRGGSPGDGSVPDAPGGCLPMDFECAAPGATCCAGTECVQATPRPICLTPCQQNADCPTDCCLEYGNIRGKVCAPAAECANCAPAGRACADASTRCCQGTLCATIENVQSCTPECTRPSDCETNCCVPLGNISRSVCLDARYCPMP